MIRNRRDYGIDLSTPPPSLLATKYNVDKTKWSGKGGDDR